MFLVHGGFFQIKLWVRRWQLFIDGGNFFALQLIPCGQMFRKLRESGGSSFLLRGCGLRIGLLDFFVERYDGAVGFTQRRVIVGLVRVGRLIRVVFGAIE